MDCGKYYSFLCMQLPATYRAIFRGGGGGGGGGGGEFFSTAVLACVPSVEVIKENLTGDN